MPAEHYNRKPDGYTPDDVARWLLEVLQSVGTIDRDFQVRQVARYFGPEFSVRGNDGMPTFPASVFEAVGRLDTRGVVFDPALKAWRWQEASEACPILVWHHRMWESIMVSTARHDSLVYRRGDRVNGAEGIALRVRGRDYEWSEAGRRSFSCTEAPATIYVEITSGTARRQFTSVHAFHKPEPAPLHGTPASKPLQSQ